MQPVQSLRFTREECDPHANDHGRPKYYSAKGAFTFKFERPVLDVVFHATKGGEIGRIDYSQAADGVIVVCFAKMTHIRAATITVPMPKPNQGSKKKR